MKLLILFQIVIKSQAELSRIVYVEPNRIIYIRNLYKICAWRCLHQMNWWQSFTSLKILARMSVWTLPEEAKNVLPRSLKEFTTDGTDLNLMLKRCSGHRKWIYRCCAVVNCQPKKYCDNPQRCHVLWKTYFILIKGLKLSSYHVTSIHHPLPHRII